MLVDAVTVGVFVPVREAVRLCDFVAEGVTDGGAETVDEALKVPEGVQDCVPDCVIVGDCVRERETVGFCVPDRDAVMVEGPVTVGEVLGVSSALGV